MTFTEWCKKNWEPDNLCPPELEYNQAIHFLYDYLASPYTPYITAMPMNGKQCNVEIVDYILMRYSPIYRVERGVGSIMDKIITWFLKHFSYYGR